MHPYQEFYHACFSSTYNKTGTIQKRLAWPLHKDDMQICEAFHILKKKEEFYLSALQRDCDLQPIGHLHETIDVTSAVRKQRSDARPGKQYAISL